MSDNQFRDATEMVINATRFNNWNNNIHIWSGFVLFDTKQEQQMKHECKKCQRFEVTKNKSSYQRRQPYRYGMDHQEYLQYASTNPQFGEPDFDGYFVVWADSTMNRPIGLAEYRSGPRGGRRRMRWVEPVKGAHVTWNHEEWHWTILIQYPF